MTKNNKKINPLKPLMPGSDEFQTKMSASQDRMKRSDSEFDQAFQILNKYPKRVTVFGSARDVQLNQKYRQAATELSAKLAQAGFAVVTGGGPGIMEAANKGAYQAGGGSIGFNITLPHEQHPNPYTTDELNFKHFFTRKVALSFFSSAYIYFPGGFGTLDEMFEVITLMQTKKMPKLPLFWFGSDVWNGLDEFVKKQMLANQTISPGDENIYQITDDVDFIVDTIKKSIN